MKDNEYKEYGEYGEKTKEQEDPERPIIIFTIIILGAVYFFGEDSSIAHILLGIWSLLISRVIQQENEDDKKRRNDNFLVKFVNVFLFGIAPKLVGIFLILHGIYLFFA